MEFGSSEKKTESKIKSEIDNLLQVNLFQELLFLHQLTHNMTKDCSCNYHENYKRRTWAEIRASDKDLPVAVRIILSDPSFRPAPLTSFQLVFA